jgi:hypothetical protein
MDTTPSILSSNPSANLKSDPSLEIPVRTNGMHAHPVLRLNNPITDSNATNVNINPEPRRFKRTHSDKHNIVSGRSFKKLRLDHTLVAVTNQQHAHHNNANPFDAQSLGTLSVGTMGGDLESNDEDTGNYDDEEEEEGESGSKSSWVASLPSLGSRRRMLPLGGLDGKAGCAAGALKQEEIDDAATCSEMTTAAVAPRRRTQHRARKRGKQNGEALPLLMNGDRKRRAIGFMIDTTAGLVMETELKEEEDLVVEEIQLDNLLHENAEDNVNGNPESMLSSPPVECIPDPLLVAAQHAMGSGGGGSDDKSQNMNSDAAATALLFVGDCYSSVTEEETSLAEDEASLSAISVGALSVGNTTMASSKGGAQCHSVGSDVDVHRTSSQETADSMRDVELKAAPPPQPGYDKHNINNAMQQADKESDYNSLNRILGGLHRERQHRLSAMSSSSPHRRESSFHSLGSMGVCSNVSGNSHQSCPNYYCAVSQPLASLRGRTAESSMMDHAATYADMDVEMEGGATHLPSGSANSSHAGSEDKQSADSIPKWKRRVNLPSHSSLF